MIFTWNPLQQVFAGANGFEWAQPTPTEENCGCPPRHGRSSFWGLGGARTRPQRRAGFGLSDHNTPQTALKQTTNDFHPNPREKWVGAEKKPASVDASGLFQLIRVSDHQQHIRMARHPRRTPARQITARQPGTRLVDKPRLVHHPHAVPIHRHLMRLDPTLVRRAPAGPLHYIAATNTSNPVRVTPSTPPTDIDSP